MTTAVSQSPNRLLTIVLCILLPPAAVAMSRGIGAQFLLSIVLTLAGFWIAGVIHALIVAL